MRIFHRLIAVLLIVFAVFASFAVTVAADGLPLSAESAILIEAESGRVIYESNARARMAMASTTKIMTALIALERGDLESTVTVANAAVGVEGSSIYLHTGEKLTLMQLVLATMLESANDAAAALACEIAGSVEAFAVLMNEKAAELGLCDTHFTNPHGLYDPNHYTTAYDLAKLAAFALENDDFRAVVSTYRTTIPLDGDNGTRVLQNHNKLLRFYPDAIGVKTGYTKNSGRCLVSAAERDGVRLVAVTLNAPDDWNDHMAMLDYGFSLYERRSMATAGNISIEVPVVGGTAETVAAVNCESFELVMPRDSPEITSVTELCRFYAAPVSAGDVLGRVVYYCGGEVVGEMKLTAADDVPLLQQPDFWDRLLEKITGGSRQDN